MEKRLSPPPRDLCTLEPRAVKDLRESNWLVIPNSSTKSSLPLTMVAADTSTSPSKSNTTMKFQERASHVTARKLLSQCQFNRKETEKHVSGDPLGRNDSNSEDRWMNEHTLYFLE